MPIPPHRPDGTLPPVSTTVIHRPEEMTPFPATLEELVRRFATSVARVRILEGFFAMRARLHELGVAEGFQWIGGGFVELRPREPEDMDVVTFFRKPAAWSAPDDEARAVRGEPELFTAPGARARYRCDAYFVDLGAPSAPRWIAHWCGVHSHHMETRAWKGFVEVPLAPDAPGDLWGAALAEQREALGLA
jgi:hypothetical protein